MAASLKGLATHLKPSNGEAPKHHGKTQSHVVSDTFFEKRKKKRERMKQKEKQCVVAEVVVGQCAANMVCLH